MLTPFNADGSIDFKGLERLTELYLNAGAAGLFANCLSSETFELTEAERLLLIEKVMAYAGNTVPVVAAGGFGETLDDKISFIKKAYDKGVEAVILITNQFARADEPDDIFNERIFELLDKTEGVQYGFYECPEPYKRLLSPEQLALFVSSGRVIYQKDTCLDIQQVRKKLHAVRGHNFGLYDAYMGHAVQSLKAGAAGLSCIQGNFFPELIVWLCENYDQPELQTEVDMVQRFFQDNMEVMHHVYPVIAKHFLQKRNLPISSYCRKNYGLYTAAVHNSLERLQRDYAQLIAEIGLEKVM